jgi:regulator of replication initiation timing
MHWEEEMMMLKMENKRLKKKIAELKKKQPPEPQDDIPLDQRIRESADYYVATDGKDDV